VNINQAKDLFQLQSELIDMKVDMAVNKAIDRVMDGIADLKGDIHQLEKRFITLDHRIKSTKATVSALTSVLRQIRTKSIEYFFRAVWFMGGAVLLYVLSLLRYLIK